MVIAGYLSCFIKCLLLNEDSVDLRRVHHHDHSLKTRLLRWSEGEIECRESMFLKFHSTIKIKLVGFSITSVPNSKGKPLVFHLQRLVEDVLENARIAQLAIAAIRKKASVRPHCLLL
jgi:hypothetical protein